MTKRKKKKVEETWFDSLLRGTWYRGTDAKGRGLGVAFLGSGLYLTWDKDIADGFAWMACNKSGNGPAKLHKYKLKPNLKILDNQSTLMNRIKLSMGVDPWDKIDDPLFSAILTHHIKRNGYDGVIDDDSRFGIVIFDNQNVIKL